MGSSSLLCPSGALIIAISLRTPSSPTARFANGPSICARRYFTGRSGVAAFALTTQVLGHETWTPELLETRQERLLGTLRAEWAL